MSYNIEIKTASKNGWFTPEEARKYYGRYSRQGITWHWWGGGEGANKHDNIVNYFLSQGAAGNKSVNYVLSDNKVTLMVNPDNVAWTSQSGNATTVSVECQPTLGAEGYKKAGWLASELAGRYGGDRSYYPHQYWYTTSCPGTISLDRIRQEEDKWQRGEYNPAPPTPPTPPTPTPVNIEFTQYKEGVRPFIVKKDTNLWDFNSASWGGVKAVKPFKNGEQVDIKGYAINHNLGATYLLTPYSFDKKITNGFNEVDLNLKQTPAPTPEPVVEVTPIGSLIMYTLANAKLVNIKDMTVVKTFDVNVQMEIAGKSIFKDKEYYLTKYAVDNNTKQGFLVGDLKNDITPTPNPEPEKPEWEKNLQDQDDTEYWLTKDQELIDITTGKPTTGNSAKVLKKDESFVASAWTIANGVEYRITDYSFKKGVFNGVPVSSLTLTKPGVPDVPPVVHDPSLIEKNVVIAFLETIGRMIAEFIAKLKS